MEQVRTFHITQILFTLKCRIVFENRTSTNAPKWPKILASWTSTTPRSLPEDQQHPEPVYCIIKESWVDRKVSGSPVNKKLEQKFLDKLAKAVDKSPTVSIQTKARKLRISKSTCRKSLKMLQKHSLVCPLAPLLMEWLMALRLERSKRCCRGWRSSSIWLSRSSPTRRCSQSTRSTIVATTASLCTRVSQLPLIKLSILRASWWSE